MPLIDKSHRCVPTCGGLSSKHLLSLSRLHFCSNAEKRSLNGSRLPPMVLPVEEEATPTRVRRSATRNKSTVTKLLHTKSIVPLSLFICIAFH